MSRNVLFSTMDHVLLPVLWLIAMPIFVSKLGIDRFGVWMLVNSLLGFSGLFAFGLSDATIKYVSHYRALGNATGACRVIQSTLNVYMILGLGTGIVVTLGAPLLAGTVFKVEPKDAALLILCLKISGLGIVARMFDSVMQSALQGFERYDLAAGVSMVCNFTTVVINVITASLGYGLELLILTAIGLLALSGVVKMALIRIYLTPEMSIRPCWDKKALAEIFSFGIYSWLQGISGILLGQADRLMIASMMGTRELAYYTACLQLAQQIHALPSKAAACLFPLVSAARALGDTDRLRDLFFRSNLLVTSVGLALGVPIFVSAREILTIWMGVTFAIEGAPILQILALAFSLFATTIVPYYYITGAGYVRLGVLLSVGAMILVLTSGLLLIPILGVIGAAWSRLAFIGTNLIARYVVHFRILGDKRWFAPFCAVIPVFTTFGICVLLIDQLPVPSSRLEWLVIRSLLWSGFGLLLGAAFTFILTPARDRAVLLDRSSVRKSVVILANTR